MKNIRPFYLLSTVLIFAIIFAGIISAADTTPPLIVWNTAPADGAILYNTTTVTLNTTISDANQTSAFFDWNQTLLAYWSFDYYNTTGVYDNSTYSNFGTFADGLGTGSIVSGNTARYGSAVRFNAAGGHVTAPGNILGTLKNLFTIEMWMKPANNTQSDTYLLQDNIGLNQWAVIYEYSDNSVEFYTYGHTGTDPPRNGSQMTVSDTNWHHIAYTYNGSNWKGYLDGSQIFSTSRTFTLPTGAGKIYLGASDYANYFNGTLDEIRIYNRSLSPAEINASYNNSKYSLNHSFTSLAVGTYNYTAYAIDTAGNLNITSTRNVTVMKSLYDSRDTSPPSSGGTWDTDESLLVSGQGWGSNQVFNITVNDSNSHELCTMQITAGSVGNFASYDTICSLTSGAAGTATLYVSTSGVGGNWAEYDTFTINQVPEFPSGVAIVFLASALIYTFMRKESV